MTHGGLSLATVERETGEEAGRSCKAPQFIPLLSNRSVPLSAHASVYMKTIEGIIDVAEQISGDGVGEIVCNSGSWCDRSGSVYMDAAAVPATEAAKLGPRW